MSSGDPLELFTFADLAAMWQTGEDWIRRGVSARKYPHRRPAGHVRFTREDAAEILASLAVRPATVPTVDQVAERRAEVGRSRRKDMTGPVTGGSPSGPRGTARQGVPDQMPVPQPKPAPQ